MKITQITKQDTRDRYNVFVDDEFAVALAADTLIDSGFGVGDEVTEDELQRYGQKDLYAKLLTKALGFVSRRPHSRGELADKLGKHDAPPEVVEDVLLRLEELEYVDDLAFARQWVAERGTKRGPTLLKQELYRKKIADETIQTVLAEQSDGQDQFAAAYEVAIARWPRLVDKPNAERKLADFLIRRGYSYEVIKAVRKCLVT
jgi:regulatory protein